MADTRTSSNGAFRVGTSVLGALILLLGALAFSAPFLAGVAAELLFGGALVVAGILRIVFAAKGGATGRVGISALLGVLGILAGAVLLLRPVLGLLTLTLVLGAYLVAHGLLETFAALQWRKRARPWGWMLFGGVISVLLGGFILVEWPVSGLFTLGVFMAVHLGLIGVGLLIAAIVGEADLSRGAPHATPAPA